LLYLYISYGFIFLLFKFERFKRKENHYRVNKIIADGVALVDFEEDKGADGEEKVEGKDNRGAQFSLDNGFYYEPKARKKGENKINLDYIIEPIIEGGVVEPGEHSNAVALPKHFEFGPGITEIMMFEAVDALLLEISHHLRWSLALLLYNAESSGIVSVPIAIFAHTDVKVPTVGRRGRRETGFIFDDERVNGEEEDNNK